MSSTSRLLHDLKVSLPPMQVIRFGTQLKIDVFASNPPAFVPVNLE
jgi:hypothetical protein